MSGSANCNPNLADVSLDEDFLLICPIITDNAAGLVNFGALRTLFDSLFC